MLKNYRAIRLISHPSSNKISLISHPSKLLLRVLVNKIEQKSEEIFSEEQASFRSGRSTSEHISNIKALF